MAVGGLPVGWGRLAKAPSGIPGNKSRSIFNACLGLWMVEEGGGGYLVDRNGSGPLKAVTQANVSRGNGNRGPYVHSGGSAGGYFSRSVGAWAYKIPLTLAAVFRSNSASQGNVGLLSRDGLSLEINFQFLELDALGGQTWDNANPNGLIGTDVSNFMLGAVTVDGTNGSGAFTVSTMKFIAVYKDGTSSSLSGGGNGTTSADGGTFSNYNGSGSGGSQAIRVLCNSASNVANADVVLAGMWNRILSLNELRNLFLRPYDEIF